MLFYDGINKRNMHVCTMLEGCNKHDISFLNSILHILHSKRHQQTSLVMTTFYRICMQFHDTTITICKSGRVALEMEEKRMTAE